jgi:glycosyltransferase involved in cell wall biosynthesis
VSGTAQHVLLVDSSGYEDLGGASTVINEVIEGVDRDRFLPALACLSPGRWPDMVRERGTPAYSFPRARLRSARNLATLVFGLRGVIRLEHSALVHASENSALLYASIAARMCRTPVIWHIHSPLLARTRPERLVARLLRRLRPAHIVYTSPGARQRSMPFPGVPWSVVMPGVDIVARRAGDAPRARRALGLPDDAEVISMFARIEPMKGQVDFVECLGRLARHRPRLYGVMCGPADQGAPYWHRIQTRAHDLDLGDRLLIPGDVRPPLRDDVMAASAVVVHPSHAESFGLAVLEAMAAGRPVVAADTDGPRLLIEDGVDGVLTPVGDVDALTAAVGGLLDDAAARARMATAAQSSAAHHTVQEMVAGVEAVWEGVLVSGARRAR